MVAVLFFGIIGMIFILVAFILDEFYNQFNQNTVKYNLFNVIGSLFLVYYAFILKGWPFLVLNLVWFVVALLKLMGILKKREYVSIAAKGIRLKK